MNVNSAAGAEVSSLVLVVVLLFLVDVENRTRNAGRMTLITETRTGL
jgi:hypothetical protein